MLEEDILRTIKLYFLLARFSNLPLPSLNAGVRMHRASNISRRLVIVNISEKAETMGGEDDHGNVVVLVGK